MCIRDRVSTQSTWDSFRMFYFALILLAQIFLQANAWSATPHMIIYAIAKKDIKSDIWQKMETLFHYMKETDANYPQWLEMACWADDQKGAGLSAFDEWHFYNQIYLDGISKEQCKVIVNKENCVVHTVETSVHLQARSGGDLTFHKSLMLRYLVHLMGDMHQPLHETTRCTNQQRNGDKGGNLFKLNYKISNLHALWDEAMGMIPSVKRPLDSHGITTIDGFVKDITKEFPREKLAQELRVNNFYDMAKSVHEIAIKEAYAGIKENSAPSDDYLKSRYVTCKKLIALAGYRLADFLNNYIKQSGSIILT
eukprot:TRINITY_DN76_c0_g1_i8.p1 TRINITY_DN76_c0_g1~~TRINITY_DN76_c0_g1_i8.p1  ORF type:complete len:310 (+),score=88.23 TRINITY_DN76_c0_g1_i8:65-994(+)